MISLLQDLRFAIRQMRRSPGFAMTAVLILALGTAANVIVFGVLQEMVLQPVNVPHADRVVTFAPRVSGYPIFSYPEIRDVRDSATLFSAVSAYNMLYFGLEVNNETRPVWGNEVSGQYFDAAGIKPFLGRLLKPSDDDHPGASEAVVISWSLWKSHFDSDQSIVGKRVRIDKRPYTIVGVTPEGFNGTEKFLRSDLFVPMANQAFFEGDNWLENRRNKGVFPFARLKDGVTMAQAQDELDRIAARIVHANPKDEDGLQLKLAPPGLVGDYVRGAARRFLAGVMGLALIVLLAACANLGSLFAARTADRTREIAIRVAIGSSRWRVLRQVLMEAFVISCLGGVCACALSWIALSGLAKWHPPSDYPMRFDVQPQPSLVLFAFLISLAAGAAFGLMPLRQIFKTDPNEAIKSGGSQSGGPRWALRDILLAAQIALCCITVTAAVVSLRGLSKTLNMDIGMQPRNATLTKFDLSQAAYTPEAAEQFQRNLQEKMLHLPGVIAAGYASGTPLSDPVTTSIFTQQTTDFRPSKEAFDAFFYDVSPGYFAAAGTPLLAGRDFHFSDTAKTPMVAVVNRQFAQSLFHVDNAVGRYFKNHSGVSIQIVGMVPDGKYFLTSEDSSEAVFFPILQRPSTTTSLVVRTRPNSMAGSEMISTIRETIHELDPGIPIRSSDTWINQLAFSFFPAQVATISLGLFGAFGLLLSITGTFGLASYTVSKRMRELSIRVALGAQAKQVLSAALGRMLTLIGIGSAIGMGLGIATGRLLSHIVYQATAQDPVVLISVSLTIVFTGALSVAGPVKRALQVDPASILREQ